MITEREKLFGIAMLLEGEGWFGCNKNSLQIICKMTDKEPLQRLKIWVNGGHILGPYLHKDQLGNKLQWVWHLSKRREVVNLILKIRPLMCPRRQLQIDRMLEFNKLNPIRKERRDTVEHGTITMYINHRCRCSPCKQTMSLYKKKYYKEYGN